MWGLKGSPFLVIVYPSVKVHSVVLLHDGYLMLMLPDFIHGLLPLLCLGLRLRQVTSVLEDGVVAVASLSAVCLLTVLVFLVIYWSHAVVRTSSKNMLVVICLGIALAIAGVFLRIR